MIGLDGVVCLSSHDGERTLVVPRVIVRQLFGHRPDTREKKGLGVAGWADGIRLLAALFLTPLVPMLRRNHSPALLEGVTPELAFGLVEPGVDRLEPVPVARRPSVGNAGTPKGA